MLAVDLGRARLRYRCGGLGTEPIAGGENTGLGELEPAGGEVAPLGVLDREHAVPRGHRRHPQGVTAAGDLGEEETPRAGLSERAAEELLDLVFHVRF